MIFEHKLHMFTMLFIIAIIMVYNWDTHKDQKLLYKHCTASELEHVDM